MLHVLSRAFRPESEDDVYFIRAGLWWVFAGVVLCGVILEGGMGLRGALQASGGVALGLTVAWLAFVLPYLSDLVFSARMQLYYERRDRAGVLEVVEAYNARDRDEAREAIETIEQRVSEKENWVSETQTGLRLLIIAEGAIVLLCTLITSLSPFIPLPLLEYLATTSN